MDAVTSPEPSTIPESIIPLEPPALQEEKTISVPVPAEALAVGRVTIDKAELRRKIENDGQVKALREQIEHARAKFSIKKLEYANKKELVRKELGKLRMERGILTKKIAAAEGRYSRLKSLSRTKHVSEIRLQRQLQFRMKVIRNKMTSRAVVNARQQALKALNASNRWQPAPQM